jgi:hypothetical protein
MNRFTAGDTLNWGRDSFQVVMLRTHRLPQLYDGLDMYMTIGVFKHVEMGEVWMGRSLCTSTLPPFTMSIFPDHFTKITTALEVQVLYVLWCETFLRAGSLHGKAVLNTITQTLTLTGLDGPGQEMCIEAVETAFNPNDEANWAALAMRKGML